MSTRSFIGTPWHIGYVNKSGDDPKRHKSRCKFYENPFCRKLIKRCTGSSHCSHYIEKSQKDLIGNQSKNDRLVRSNITQPKDIIEKLTPGSVVIHRYWGKAKVIKLNGDWLELSFSLGIQKRFSLELCLREKLLSF